LGGFLAGTLVNSPPNNASGSTFANSLSFFNLLKVGLLDVVFGCGDIFGKGDFSILVFLTSFLLLETIGLSGISSSSLEITKAFLLLGAQFF